MIITQYTIYILVFVLICYTTIRGAIQLWDLWRLQADTHVDWLLFTTQAVVAYFCVIKAQQLIFGD